ncbi:hypothetical protein [Hymenobacter sp. YC55]|uniref:hypothetical protein n=1 Tax=Hymenobacter sp. YC55 TaxID=3034019 RepID=UPI0023F74910|nr:hypothetical protein [Hymenobacter sp. YC55]MDF7813780.1 hypothetical protein [Hymenobacter sp. YC55]
MKNLLILLAIVFVAIGSWSFYPKASATTGYMAVIGSGRPGKTRSAEITILYPDGRRTVQELSKIKVSNEGPSAAGALEIHHAELQAVNKLYAQGWKLVHVVQSTVGAGASTETVYLLERR